jgi:hypothetical protein
LDYQDHKKTEFREYKDEKKKQKQQESRWFSLWKRKNLSPKV